MTNNCKVDFMTKEIRVTKSFYKAAQIFGTEEFNTMVDLTTKLPTYKIVFQDHSQPIRKVWQPTYLAMMEYISLTTHEDSAAIDELWETVKLARLTGMGYSMVRRWFMEKYSEAYAFPNSECELVA